MVVEENKEKQAFKKIILWFKKIKMLMARELLVRNRHFSSPLYSFVPSFNENPDCFIGQDSGNEYTSKYACE